MWNGKIVGYKIKTTKKHESSLKSWREVHLCVCCYKSLILVIVRRRISTTEALFLDFFKGLTVWPNWIQMFKHLMENKMYCAFRSTPTGWLVMLCGVFKGHLAALANIWHVFFLVYVCVVHTCYYSTPGLLSELASLTMLWGGVTHAACWTMWNHSSVPLC